jgi:hypothetical protein
MPHPAGHDQRTFFRASPIDFDVITEIEVLTDSTAAAVLASPSFAIASSMFELPVLVVVGVLGVVGLAGILGKLGKLGNLGNLGLGE